VYNLRYHIASLVAVFLALSVGLLLGTIVVERGVLSAQRSTLVEGIRQDVDKVNAANQQLKATNGALSAYAAATAPEVVRGVFEGRTVLVLADPEAGETVARTTDAVKLAGGDVAVAEFSSAGFSLGEPKVRDAAMKALGSPEASQLETGVAETLAKEWTTPGDSRVLTAALMAAGGLKLSGLAATATVGAAAVSAVYAGVPDPDALRLAAVLARDGRFAAGVEIKKKATGQARAALKAGLSGVDDVDSPLGQVSLVWVLAGRSSGYYGSGTGVDGPFPQPLFAQP
jgi:hypothetical protein